MTTTDRRPIIQTFDLSDLAHEFTRQTTAEIERRRSLEPDFDEALYRQARDLVLRKLQHRESRDVR